MKLKIVSGVGLAVAAVLTGSLWTRQSAWGISKTTETPISAIELQKPDERPAAPDFPKGKQWFNTDKELSFKDLKGKIVILDFWTYCCINCMHIIPDLKKLEAKYPNELVVIGVHSAKFENERDSENIRSAILRYQIEHPVINDADMGVWNTWGANSWPTVVLIDPEGKVVGGKAGEGVFEPFDGAIKQLIKEADAKKTLKRSPFKVTLEKDKKPASVLSYPGKIVGDVKNGRLFITDSNHNRIVIMSLSGAIQEVIGEGSEGMKDGDFETAKFNRPQGLCYDAATNSIYVADTENHAVRQIDLAAKKVLTLVGNGKQTTYPPTGGVGVTASLSSPWDILKIGNTLYVAMAGTHQLWTIDAKTLEANPYAGNAGENIVDGSLAQAQLAQPSGITTDGNLLYFADSEVSAVRSAGLNGKGEVKTIIGEGLFKFGDVDGKYPTARLQHCIGVTYKDGFIYVADTYNHKIRQVNPRTRTVTSYIGTGKRGMADGQSKTASLNEPNGVVWVGTKLYITDTNNHLIRVFDPATNMLSTLKLTGLEKLTKKTMPQFTGKEITLNAQEVSANAKTLEFNLQLPKGTKFNKEAPFRLKVLSSKPEAVTIGTANITQPSNKLSIPITPKSGETTISIEMQVNFCDEGNSGLCYFREVRLVIPVKVNGNGDTPLQVNYAM